MELLTILLELGLTPFNLILVGMLYLLMAHVGIAPAPWKKERNYDDGKPLTTIQDLGNKFANIQKEIFKLKEYYNHETTGQQAKMISLLEEMNSKMDRHNEMEKENHSQLKEIIKYGVKCRNE